MCSRFQLLVEIGEYNLIPLDLVKLQSQFKRLGIWTHQSPDVPQLMLVWFSCLYLHMRIGFLLTSGNKLNYVCRRLGIQDSIYISAYCNEDSLLHLIGRWIVNASWSISHLNMSHSFCKKLYLLLSSGSMVGCSLATLAA